jgi:hypothetical protein
MARKYTLFIYNTSDADQQWTIYSADVINQNVTVGKVRKSYTLMVSGDVTIQFGVDDTIYLTATYTYATDSWTSHTVTPNEIAFATGPGAITVSSSYSPD